MGEVSTERRRWPRIDASEFAGIAVTIIGGPDVKVVNVSRGGVLIEVPARLALRSAVRLVLTQASRTIAEVRGCVVWQKVASIANGQINYRIAVAFEQPIESLGHPGEDGQLDTPQTQPAAPARDNVAPFPSPVAPVAAPAVVAPAREPIASPPAAAALDADALKKKLESAKTDLQCQAAVLESVCARLKDSDQERARLASEAAEALARAGALQATLEKQAHAQGDAVREQQDRYDSIAAQLVEATDRTGALQATLDEQARAHEDAVREQQSRYDSIAAQLAEANDRTGALQATLDEQARAHEDAVRELQSRHESIAAQLAEANDRAVALQATLDEQARAHKDAVRAQQSREDSIAAQLVDATDRGDTLQATLDEQARAHADALREQETRYTGIVEQLIQGNDDQQKDYQALAAQLKVALEDRDDLEAARVEWQARERDLIARLEAAELVCVSQRERLRILRRETEKLLWTFTSSPSSAIQSQADDEDGERAVQAG